MNDLSEEVYTTAHDKRILLSLMLELLTTCNENCIHCYIPKHNNGGLSLGVIKRAIKEFRELGGFNLSLTGGEIFLRKDLLEIIEYARLMGLRVFLLTNGSLITRSVAKELKKLCISELSVSVYSLDETIHDSITRCEGSLRRTLDGIRYANEQGLRITVKTPLMNINRFSYIQLADFCKEKGYQYLASTVIFAKSNGDKSVKSLSINKNDMANVSRAVSAYEPVGMRNKFDEACGSLRYSLAIDANGDIFPCNSFYLKMGNVYQDGLEDVWKSKQIQMIQNIKKSDLDRCCSCQIKEKCNRCPGLAYLEDGDYRGCSRTARESAMYRL